MLKSLQSLLKQLTKNKIVMLIAAVCLGYALYNYSKGKGLTLSGMTNDVRVEKNAEPRHGQHQTGPSVDGGADNYQPAHPEGENTDYGNADGMDTDTYGLPPSCAKQQVVDPKELLPRDNNSEFSKLNPSAVKSKVSFALLAVEHKTLSNIYPLFLTNTHSFAASFTPLSARGLS